MESGALLSLALTVAISPLPIIAVVLILATPRGRVNGPAMVGGWVATLAAIGGLAVGAGDLLTRDAGAAAGAWLSIGFGALLLVGAARQWRGRPRGDGEPRLPAWMARLDGLSPAGAAGVGAVAVLNPKNLVPSMAGAALIAGSGVPATRQLAAFAGFVALATAGLVLPVAVRLAFGRRAEPALERLRQLLARHNAVILAVLFTVLGLALLRSGLAQ